MFIIIIQKYKNTLKQYKKAFIKWTLNIKIQPNQFFFHCFEVRLESMNGVLSSTDTDDMTVIIKIVK